MQISMLKKSYMGYHTDCDSASDGKCVVQSNPQVESTPALIYSFGGNITELEE